MYFGLWYVDPVYIAIFLLTLFISLVAQIFMSATFRKWGGVRNGAGLTGGQVGRELILRTDLGDDARAPELIAETPEMKRLAELRDKEVISDREYQAKIAQLQRGRSRSAPTGSTVEGIHFERTPGQLTDHYDPRSNTVRLSEATADKDSVAAMAVVAHELGHAQQHETGSILMSMRNFLVPAVSLSPRIAYLLILVGWIFALPGFFQLGILFYGLMVLFAIVTIPVEVDASRRALKLLNGADLMRTDADRQGSRRVLAAAASTYIAAAITAILQLLYYISLARRRG
jgi:Zn-dependent membrane protease YugP